MKDSAVNSKAKRKKKDFLVKIIQHDFKFEGAKEKRFDFLSCEL